MAYKVLALKYRPQTFASVVGQQATLTVLQHALDHQQIHHAYLFTGTRGVGKTTLARILAKCLNCEQGISAKPCGSCDMCVSIADGANVDVIEIDAASRTKVEDTRELLDNVPYAPVRARFKTYIIDEVHMLSNHSFNALLKTLEEPPPHVKFILATTDPQKLPITILSRCLQFHLRNLTVDQIVPHLQQVLQQEQIGYEDAALAIVAEAANGSMRDALSLLEQVIAFGGRNVTLQAAQQILGTGVRTQTIELLQAIAAADARRAIAIVRELAQVNADFNQVLKNLQTLIHNISLAQVVPEALPIAVDNAQILQLAAKITPMDLQLYYQTALLGVRDLPYAHDIVTGFEMIVLRMLAFQPVFVNELPLPASTSVNTKPISAEQVTPPSAPVVAQELPTTAPAPVTATNDWVQVIARLNISGLTKVIAEHCTVAQWQPEAITLTLQESQKPLLNAKHIERLQAALQEYLSNKVKLTINCGVTIGETPAAQGQRMQQAVASAAEQAIRSDIHIQQLEQTFAAKIADIHINEKTE